jgi:hypothetical protein
MRRVGGPCAAWAVLALAAAGCGLADYEERMQQAQRAADRYDEENKYLGDPLVIPDRKPEPPAEGKAEGKAEGRAEGRRGPARAEPLVNLFLRPPKGISPKPEDQPIQEVLYRYGPVTAAQTRTRGAGPAPGRAGAGGSPGSGFTDVYLAVGDDSDEFVDKALAPMPRTEDKLPPAREHRVPLPGGQALNFGEINFAADDADYSAYFHRSRGRRVVLVYRMAKDQRAKLAHVVDLSLSTFALDEQAEQMASAFRGRPRPGGAPAAAPAAKAITR